MGLPRALTRLTPPSSGGMLPRRDRLRCRSRRAFVGSVGVVGFGLSAAVGAQHGAVSPRTPQVWGGVSNSPYILDDPSWKMKGRALRGASPPVPTVSPPP